MTERTVGSDGEIVEDGEVVQANDSGSTAGGTGDAGGGTGNAGGGTTSGALTLRAPHEVTDPTQRAWLERAHANGLPASAAPAWAVTGGTPDFSTVTDQVERAAQKALGGEEAGSETFVGDDAQTIYETLTAENRGGPRLMPEGYENEAMAIAGVLEEASLTSSEVAQIGLETSQGLDSDAAMRMLAERLGGDRNAAMAAVSRAEKTLEKHPNLKKIVNGLPGVGNSPALVLALAD